MNPEILPTGSQPTHPERGRAAIPIEQALAIQADLIAYMVGPRWEGLTDGEKDVVMSEWFEKYASNEPRLGTGFNVFGEYCDSHADDADFVNRIVAGQWTEDDLEAMRKFAETSPKGGVFMPLH